MRYVFLVILFLVPFVYGIEPIGSSDAPIKMIMYLDSEGSFDQRWFTESFPNIKAQYIDTGDVLLKIHHMPLKIRLNAENAAVALECADKQKKVLEYLEILIDAGDTVEENIFYDYAEKSGLNQKEFNECYDDPEIRELINKEREEAESKGIRGTPTFIIEEEKIEGAQDYMIFAKLFDSLLNPEEEIKKEIPKLNTNECIDSDGGNNPYEAGSAVLGNIGVDDNCFFMTKEKGTLMEGVCHNGQPVLIEVECPSSAPFCNKGKCAEKPGLCIESDEGIQPEVRGSILEPRYESGPELVDHCLENNLQISSCSGDKCYLREYYCLKPFKETMYEDIPCESCEKGVCNTQREEKIKEVDEEIKEEVIPQKSLWQKIISFFTFKN